LGQPDLEKTQGSSFVITFCFEVAGESPTTKKDLKFSGSQELFLKTFLILG